MLDVEKLREACAKVAEAFKHCPHLSEAVYQRALQIELQERGHTVVAEVVKPVKYYGMHVGTVRADLVVHDRNADDFVLELKRAPKILQSHIDQLNTYLSLTVEQREEPSPVVGAVVNFGVRPVEIYFEDVWARKNDPDPDLTRSPSPARAKSRSRSRSPKREPNENDSEPEEHPLGYNEAYAEAVERGDW
jgi:GxxExxY protein